MMGFGLLGVVLLVGAAFAFMRNGSGIQDMIGTRNTPASVEEDAQQILDQRYARGEITREQYQNIKKDLA